MHPVILTLLLLPLLAVVVIFSTRRIRATAHLTPARVISGVTGAILVAIIVFMFSTVPIAPYELDINAWTPIYGQVLLSLTIGFGFGTIVAAVVGIPYAVIKSLCK